jgi:flagellar hook-length control protein FliK
VDLQKPTDVQRLGSSPTVGAAARTSPVDRANPPSGSSSVPGGIPALFDLWAGNTASAGTSRDPGAESILTDAPLVVLHEPVGTDAWQDQLGAQLSVMAMAGGESEAVMKLAPEDLGELEIRVMIRDGEASLQFGATNAEAREAIETAQPRLRELFTSQGMDISNFSVFSNLSGNSHSFSKNGAVPPRPERGVPATQEDLQVRVTRRAPQGIIDLYA